MGSARREHSRQFCRLLEPMSEFCDPSGTMDDSVSQRTQDTGQDNGTAVPLSATAAAAKIGVHDRTIRRAIIRGELSATKHAGVYRIAPAELAEYQARHRLTDLPRVHTRPD